MIIDLNEIIKILLLIYISTFKRRRMNYKNTIFENLCYTKFVYGRMNKKLNLSLSNEEIEKLIKLIVSKIAP